MLETTFVCSANKFSALDKKIASLHLHTVILPDWTCSKLELKKKIQLELKKNQYKPTEFLSQFEINVEMDISKNQWRSTGGLSWPMDWFNPVRVEIGDNPIYQIPYFLR